MNNSRTGAMKISPTRRKTIRATTSGLALALAVGLGAGCSKKPAADPDVLARVGSAEIRSGDLVKEAARLRKARKAVPDKSTLLQEMVKHEALVQRARNAGLPEDPELKREISNLLIGALLERELTPRLEAVQVSAEELRAEYQAKLPQYTRNAKVRLALLQLQADAKMSEARRAELRERMGEARRKLTGELGAEGFGKLALDYSDEQSSRYRGGDLGWLDAGSAAPRWPRAVLDAGYALPKGHVSDVIETPEGFYLVAKTDFREGFATPFEQVEGSLRQGILARKRRQLEEAFRQEAANLANIQINAEAIERVQLPPPPAVLAQRSNDHPPSLSLEASSTPNK